MLKTGRLGVQCLFEVPLALILFLLDCFFLLPHGQTVRRPAPYPLAGEEGLDAEWVQGPF